MSADTSTEVRVREENWLPILELSVEEVFEIMLGCRAQPAVQATRPIHAEFTALVGLAGALCGVLTVGCDAQTARQIARCLLGEIVESEEQVCNALGEICSMIAGNFRNKLTGLDGRCLLSVPTVVSGGRYNFHSLANGDRIETCMFFEGFPVVIRLELHG